ncbi:MAG TPA: CoA pyrophosphatase [Gemmatimonadales bacterium]|nr:CoA pyrophosphatase [Gemmatimonadales bacterium]
MPFTQPLSEPFAGIADRLAQHAPHEATDSGALWAAVALVLVPGPVSLLLIRRAEREGDPWSGQVGLPGGRRSAADADLLRTAMRETREEVGLALDSARPLGRLDDIAPMTPTLPPIAVRPFVFALDRRLPLTPNGEVASAHWIELGRLFAPDAMRETEVAIRGTRRVVPAYLVDDLVVWGMTHRILGLLSRTLAE